MSALIPHNAILEILEDNQWHRLREFLWLGREHISPELACREYIRMFNTPNRELPEIDLDRQISKGRRRAVERRLMGLHRRGRLEVRNRGLNKEYKKVQNA